MMRFISSAIVCVLSLPMLAAEGSVPVLNPDELNQLLKSGKWAVVEFGGAKCKPCLQMQPILAEVQKHFGDKVIIRNFHPADHKDAARPFKIMLWPTQVVFDASGKEVARHQGVWLKDQFIDALNKAGVK